MEKQKTEGLSQRKFISPKEVEVIYGIPVGTLANWRMYSKGPPYLKIGGLIKYVVADIEKYFINHRVLTSEQNGATVVSSSQGGHA